MENQALIGGRYHVLGNLGKGAMGVVFKAHDPVLDRTVAIKQMSAEIARNEELRQRFYVEARAAARLNHPHIITIHELQEADGEIYMVMELLEGRPVSSLIEGRPVPLPLEATLDLMAQVCDGLEYAHQHGIIHRDIKPANLFLTNSGVVKILDFGIARLGSLHMTATGALIGTPDYMSPEQVRGDEIDRRADVWAAGAVLYQMLSGAKPFHGRPLARLLTAITQTPHMPLQQRAPALPKSVCDLVDRMLSKPRDERPATAALVRDELRAILGRDSTPRRSIDTSEDYGETMVIQRQPGTPPAVAAASGGPAPVAIDRTLTESSPDIPAPAVAVLKSDKDEEEPTVSLRPARGTSPPPLPATVRDAGARPPAVVTPVPSSAAVTTPPVAGSADSPVAPATSSAAPRSRLGLMVGAVLALIVIVAGAGVATWWFLGPRLLEMAGFAPTAPAVTSGATTPAGGRAETASAPAQTETGSQAQASAATPLPAGPPAVDESGGKQPQPTSPPAEPQIAQPPGATPRAPQTPAAQTPAPARRAALQPARPPAAVDAPPSAGEGRPRGAAEPPPRAPEPPPRAAEPSPVAPPQRAAEKLTDDTVSTLAGQRSGSGAYAVPQGGATVAAINRITWVLEQYASALERRDADAVREHRPSLSATESQLLAAQRVSIKLENINVQVEGASATARCRRTIDATLAGGKPLREQGAVTVSLTRRATGWVITDIR